MRYVLVTRAEFPILERISCDTVLLEVDENNQVTREVGCNAEGLFIHRAPDPHAHISLGVSDIRRMPSREFESAEFEAAWELFEDDHAE
jgi:hypothetical protein